LLHNNAIPHIEARTLKTLRKLEWEVMKHPAHSPDLAPSDFHISGMLTEALGGRKFQCGDDVKMRCISGYKRNQRLSIVMALRSW
jgi:hypothetical protein